MNIPITSPKRNLSLSTSSPTPSSPKKQKLPRTNQDDSALLSTESKNTDSTKNKRISLACMLCRRKKVKCDSIQPQCTNCKNRNAQCIYAKERRRGRPPRVYTYGDLIPPGKPIAPEVQSAIEDAIISSRIHSHSHKHPSPPDTKADHTKENTNHSPRNKLHRARTDISSLTIDTSNTQTNHTKYTSFVYESNPLQPGSDFAPKYSTNHTKLNLPFQTNINPHMSNSKNFFDTNIHKSPLQYSSNIEQHPEILPGKFSENFINLFLPQIPLFSKSSLLKKINDKSISPLLWTSVCATGSDNKSESNFYANLVFQSLVINDHPTPYKDIIQHNLPILQALIIISSYYLLTLDYTRSHLCLKKAVCLMISKNLSNVDLKKPKPDTANLPQIEKLPTFSKKYLYEPDIYEIDKNTKEEIRRSCWMLFFLDRRLSIETNNSVSIPVESMRLKLPKTKDGWDFDYIEQPKSDKNNGDQLNTRHMMARSFREAISSPTLQSTNQNGKSIKKDNFQRNPCIILQYIVSALRTDFFLLLLRDTELHMIPPMSLSDVYSSISGNTQGTQHISPVMNYYSPLFSHTLPRPMALGDKDSMFISFQTKEQIKPNYSPWLYSIKRHNDLWTNSIKKNYGFGSISTLQSSWTQGSYDVNKPSTFHTTNFSNKLLTLETPMLSYSLLSLVSITESNINHDLLAFSKKYPHWSKFVLWSMDQYRNPNLTHHELFSISERKSISLKSDPSDSTELVYNSHNVKYEFVLQLVSLLIGTTFSQFFLEEKPQIISPCMSKTALKLLYDKSKDFTQNLISNSEYENIKPIYKLLQSPNFTNYEIEKPLENKDTDINTFNRTISLVNIKNSISDLGKPSRTVNEGKVMNNYINPSLADPNARNYFHQRSESEFNGHYTPIKNHHSTNSINTIPKVQNQSFTNTNQSGLNHKYTPIAPNSSLTEPLSETNSFVCLESWKKSTELALSTAAACADFARTLAFTSVLSIKLSSSEFRPMSPSTPVCATTALECFRYNFSSPIAVVGAIRILLTNYSLFSSLVSARASVSEENDFSYRNSDLILKKMVFKGKNNLSRNPKENSEYSLLSNNSKSAVWYVCQQDKHDSVIETPSINNGHKTNTKSTNDDSIDTLKSKANNMGKNLKSNTAELIVPCSITDILHGLAALMSLMESMYTFWGFESELVNFEKIISFIQNDPAPETPTGSNDTFYNRNSLSPTATHTRANSEINLTPEAQYNKESFHSKHSNSGILPVFDHSPDGNQYVNAIDRDFTKNKSLPERENNGPSNTSIQRSLNFSTGSQKENDSAYKKRDYSLSSIINSDKNRSDFVKYEPTNFAGHLTDSFASTLISQSHNLNHIVHKQNVEFGHKGSSNDISTPYSYPPNSSMNSKQLIQKGVDKNYDSIGNSYVSLRNDRFSRLAAQSNTNMDANVNGRDGYYRTYTNIEQRLRFNNGEKSTFAKSNTTQPSLNGYEYRDGSYHLKRPSLEHQKEYSFPTSSQGNVPAIIENNNPSVHHHSQEQNTNSATKNGYSYPQRTFNNNQGFMYHKHKKYYGHTPQESNNTNTSTKNSVLYNNKSDNQQEKNSEKNVEKEKDDATVAKKFLPSLRTLGL
ncbi:hypothetical protein BB559_003993 [Furculomyces boomerangus]|uniref:Zn(2)-C6 fungal-type domain-containing protein n=1 Tax=Furculomyces boomerangus TaxID=61424 RepID=A0A2T9YHD5_9FUNG|nr:hypothetical protein BB559_003993 [Furculomyces boomerangus]